MLPPSSLPGLHGEMECEGDRVRIRIAQASDEVMADTLIEEYAHAIRHEVCVPIHTEHDSIFWAIYGAITIHYRGGE